MSIASAQRWGTLEAWSPRMLLLGSILGLVFALMNGAAFLLDSFSYNRWFGHTILIGRLAILLGIAGLSVQVANRDAGQGKLSRVVVSLAVLFTVALVTLATLAGFGYKTPVIAVFGIGTVALTALTFGLFGVAIIRTGAFSTEVGGLLLAATAVLVGLFVGLMAFPTRLAGAVGEGALFAIFISIWHLVRTELEPSGRSEPAPDMVAK